MAGINRLLAKLRQEWTKNDGKPWDQWEPGPDLKDIVMRAFAVVVGGGGIILSILMMLRVI